ncbi:hypothetical protein HF1_13680 [Mycoplasma haemofelis str. Langford 1]|uniref:Uncharacterized protein n=1 Tax=Mycoplasma haemofelis (strain Langford 1) TaxID=941640 RepID=E8ZJQ5_MYCHL|nr:hypothetical protein [Mycoplasma haemofelis]CBY93376.1 hypothetical protein HF1_13680 [Mycoplasma haemofelis str. Langford 1]
MSKVKMGLTGGLASLTAGSVGAYFGLERSDGSITKVLKLDSQTAYKKGRCKVRVNKGSGEELNQSYSDFYKTKADISGGFASICLEKLSTVNINKDREDLVIKVKDNGDGSYTYEGFSISDSFSATGS